MNSHRPTRSESPDAILRRLGDQIDSDLFDVVEMIRRPLQRQAGGAVTLVALALFIGAVALLAQIVAN